MADKMYFGVPGAIEEIPYPKSGMGFVSRIDNDETELVNGGRSVYRAPTAFKTFNMTWQTTSGRLRHIIDIYNGQLGPGPYYITDPHANQENLLPSRWSNAWQLAHQSNGWARPMIETTGGIPTAPSPFVYRTDRQVKFSQVKSGSAAKLSGVVRHRMILLPKKAYYLAVEGSSTPGAIGNPGIRYRVFNSDTNTWSTPTLFTTFTGRPVEVVSAENTKATMIELDLYLPLASTLTLRGISLGTVKTPSTLWMPVGQGVGAVSFANNSDGELISSTIDRIGLSLDFVEVQNVESSVLL